MSEGSNTASQVMTIFSAASNKAIQLNHEYFTIEHLIYSLMHDNFIQKNLADLGIDFNQIQTEVEQYLINGPFDQINLKIAPVPTIGVQNVVAYCGSRTVLNPKTKLTSLDVLIYCLDLGDSPIFEDNVGINILKKNGLTALMLKKHMGVITGPKSGDDFNIGGEPAQTVSITNKQEAEEYLAKYCVNLNESAAKGKIDPIIGREDEIAETIQVVNRKAKNNCIYVGPPGVGKTVVAEGLALKIVRKQVPKLVSQSIVYALDIGLLIAGTRYRGDFEERLKNILLALSFIESPIFFIDEIHMILGAGSSGQAGTMDAANLLKPALAKGTIRCIGATTDEEFRKHIEKDRALMRRFKKIVINEPSVQDTKKILHGLKAVYEKFHGVTYTAEALDTAVDLTARYLPAGHQPDKSIDLIDNAGSRKKILSKAKKRIVDIQDIENEISKLTHIPKKSVHEGESEKLLHLRDDLIKQVYGQDQAIEALVQAVLISRSGLQDEHKPVGSYLFVGQTGTGKTEMAKQLALTLNVPLLRFNMSEYMEKHTVSRLIGAPPGYVGYDSEGSGSGLLVNSIDQHPYSVLLLDEIEKAHPDIFNIFLQVMDDGSLTSSMGKKINFRNVILIMTSNAGAREMATSRIGFTGGNNDGEEAIKTFFSPEFRNRLDAIITFGALKLDSIIRIVDKLIDELNGRAGLRGVHLTFTPEAKKWLAKHGHDSVLGARPLKRLFQKSIYADLSPLMLFGRLKDGGEAIIDVQENKIVII